jgi:hypothetical protein
MSGLIDDNPRSLGSEPLSPLSSPCILKFTFSDFTSLSCGGFLLVLPADGRTFHEYRPGFSRKRSQGIQLFEIWIASAEKEADAIT